MRVFGVFIAVFVCLVSEASSSSSLPSRNNTDNSSHSGHEKVSLNVVTFDFDYVAGPFIILLWILIASLAKLGFHFSSKISSIFPESSLLIILGIIIGGIVKGFNVNVELFTSKVFFLFMLPPIVLEAGYFLQDKAFFDNFGTILLYAVLGTLFNAFAVGLSLFGTVGNSVGLPLMPCLVFGSLIAAVDPVAVLAVFEEVHVNTMLYILVFGESLLNDAVTVVLYHMFEKMAIMDEITYKEVLLGIANFFVVSIGGTTMGLLWGLATAFTTKFTDHVRVIEPIFVFVMSYLSYLSAEMFHFSGIMSIITCAIVMKPYVERNISRKSHTTVKYFLKMMSSSSETLIFMFLGSSLVLYNHDWSTPFVLWTLFFVLLFRAIGVALLTFLANRYGRLNKLSIVDQFIMSYGGIRGAVSFSLAILLTKEHFPLKDMLVTTTIAVVMFTIFIQGTTIKPLVNILHVKLRDNESPDMYKQLNDKLLVHLVAGMEQVCGHHGHSYYWEIVEHFHNRYLRRWLVRENEDFIDDEQILLAYRKLEYKDALDHLEREGSGSLLSTSPSGHHLQELSDTNPKGHDEKDPLRAGALLRVPDAVVRDTRWLTEPSEHPSFADTAHNLNNILARSRRAYSHRKFQRNNIYDDVDDDGILPTHSIPYRAQPLRFAVPKASEAKPKTHHKHRRHRKKRHKKHDKENFPRKKKLSTIFEPEEGEAKAEEKATESESNTEPEDPGIVFTTGAVRWKIGRQLSADEPEMKKLMSGANESVNKSSESESSSSSDEESTGDESGKETGVKERSKGTDSPQGTGNDGMSSPKEAVPSESFVVDIEDGSVDSKGR